jgi:hypothetical protein
VAEGKPRFLAYLANLSDTGAFLQCSRPRDEGTPLALRLHLGSAAEDTVDLEALVIWSRGYGGRTRPTAGMGVQFRGLDQKTRDMIRDYCGALVPA